MSWSVETLDATVDAEVESLPDDMRAYLGRRHAGNLNSPGHGRRRCS